MNYPTTIKNLIECYKKLPGIGEKTAERLALATLNINQETLDIFADSIANVKTRIKRCKKCNNLSEEDLCEICSASSRDQKTICVVEEPKNVILFEKVGTYKGTYHVLDGLISPLDGINPEDIGLDKLLDRIKNENFEEIIFAFKPSIEGETTSLYIKRILDGLDVKVTRLASGVPIGADMEYVDSLTLERALNDRKEIE